MSNIIFATPEDICNAKQQAVRDMGKKVYSCGFGKPNAKNPDVVFTGCPACKNASATGMSAEAAYNDMREFLLGMGTSRD